MSQYYYNPFGNSDVNSQRERFFLRKQQEIIEKKEIRSISLAMGTAIIAYLLFQSVASSLLVFLGWTDLYEDNSTFQYAFSMIAISFFSVALPFGIMAYFNRKRYRFPVVPAKPLPFSKGFLWVSFGMMFCIIAQFSVNYIITFLQLLFDVKFSGGSSMNPDSVFSCVLSVMAVAVIPAICEEFAMRCCCMQLLKKYGKGFSVLAVSVVFGLLHGNAVQFIFAFAVGVVLGYVTVKTDSVIPAILIHAFNNGLSVISGIIGYAVGDKASNTVVLVLYFFWIIVGVVSTVSLALKGELKNQRKETAGVLTTGQKFLSFFFPGMIVPFGILIMLTALSISPN